MLKYLPLPLNIAEAIGEDVKSVSTFSIKIPHYGVYIPILLAPTRRMSSGRSIINVCQVLLPGTWIATPCSICCKCCSLHPRGEWEQQAEAGSNIQHRIAQSASTCWIKLFTGKWKWESHIPVSAYFFSPHWSLNMFQLLVETTPFTPFENVFTG